MSFGGLSVGGEWKEEAWQVAQMTWSRVLHSGVSSFTPATAGSGFLSSCQKSFVVIVVVVVVIASLVLGAKIVVVIVWG